jgi:hypothetical protein
MTIEYTQASTFPIRFDANEAEPMPNWFQVSVGSGTVTIENHDRSVESIQCREGDVLPCGFYGYRALISIGTCARVRMGIGSLPMAGPIGLPSPPAATGATVDYTLSVGPAGIVWKSTP